MYTITRGNHIKEQLQIKDGDRTLTLDVDLHVDDIARDYVELGSILHKLRQQIQQKGETEELVARFGQTVVLYFRLFFGAEQTEQILEFYESRYNEMLLDITPFLQDVVVPAIQAAQEEMKRKYTALAKRGRK